LRDVVVVESEIWPNYNRRCATRVAQTLYEKSIPHHLPAFYTGLWPTGRANRGLTPLLANLPYRKRLKPSQAGAGGLLRIATMVARETIRGETQRLVMVIVRVRWEVAGFPP
jgi:hypothetical protein